MDAVADNIVIDPSRAEAVMRVVTVMIFGGLGFVILRSLIWPGRNWW